MRQVFSFVIALMLAAFVATGPGAAQGVAQEVTTARFSVRLLGLPVGALRVARAVNPAGLVSARGHFATTGVVGVLARVGFDMAADGWMRTDGVHPRHYSETIDTGERAGEGRVSFDDDDDRIDPLTALIAAIETRPVAAGCAMNRVVFDGSRTHLLTLHEVERGRDQVICEGEFRRVSGYSAAELAHRSGYTLRVTYQVADAVMWAVKARTSSAFGPVTVVRKIDNDQGIEGEI